MKCDQCGATTKGLPNDWMIFTKAVKLMERPLFRFKVDFVLCPDCFKIYVQIANETIKGDENEN